MKMKPSKSVSLFASDSNSAVNIVGRTSMHHMWSQLFQFCTSDESVHLWQSLLKQIGYDYKPILCEFVTKTVAESLIKSFCPTVADYFSH